ncbi:MAG: hypothetical protein H0T53_01585 [Herpetosiphonaceae bacterium]|nr:hypothetical protein [Herpetosiphonaceae bacterium]
MDESSWPVEYILQQHLRSAHAVLEQLSAVSAEPPFRYVMLDILIQLAEELAAGGVSLNLVEILDDMLHVVLEDAESDTADSSDEPQWVEAA